MGAIFSTPRAAQGEADIQSVSQPLFHPRKRPDITTTNINTLFSDPKFRDLIAERLSGAVKIPTESFDGMGKVGEDSRWKIFYEFSAYLQRTFPMV